MERQSDGTQSTLLRPHAAAEYQRLYSHGVCQLPGCTTAACFDAAAQAPRLLLQVTPLERTAGTEGSGARRGRHCRAHGDGALPSTVPFVDAVPLGVPIAIESGKAPVPSRWRPEDVRALSGGLSHTLAPCVRKSMRGLFAAAGQLELLVMLWCRVRRRVMSRDPCFGCRRCQHRERRDQSSTGAATP